LHGHIWCINEPNTWRVHWAKDWSQCAVHQRGQRKHGIALQVAYVNQFMRKRVARWYYDRHSSQDSAASTYCLMVTKVYTASIDVIRQAVPTRTNDAPTTTTHPPLAKTGSMHRDTKLKTHTNAMLNVFVLACAGSAAARRRYAW